MAGQTTVLATALGGAASWGTGDFLGGIAGKRTHAVGVVFGSQFLGFMLLVAFAALAGESITSLPSLGYGAVAGLAGALGIFALYRGLATGPMSIVAPVSAVVAAMVPLPVGWFTEGLPGPLLFVGLATGLVGIYLVASGPSEAVASIRRPLLLAMVAGLGFGTFYVLFAFAGDDGTLWPLASARLASIVVVGPIMAARSIPLPYDKKVWLLTLGAGVFDATGNLCFVLASQQGRLDVAAVLLSLYPATTMLLAFVILKERIRGWQLVGVAAIVFAIVLIALA